MLLGCIADDFTGGSDLASALASNGMRTVQCNGVPPVDACRWDACVVSLKTRSVSATEAVARSLEALQWLARQGARQFLFKYCSTFDSTREGNIGPVAEALINELKVPGTIVCPAFPSLRRTVYRGYLFVGDRPLNESGLENHPLNPMTDANIVRWLGLQSRASVGLVTADCVAEGVEATRRAIESEYRAGRPLVVCDCIADQDLLTLGAAVKDMLLVTGGSGIGVGLARSLASSGLLGFAASRVKVPSGPVLALAGSCSAATRKQVEVHSAGNPTLFISVEDVLDRRIDPSTAVSWAFTAGRAAVPLIYSAVAPEVLRATQERYGALVIAAAMEEFFGAVAAAAVAQGFRRLIVAGGETASAAVTALKVRMMFVGAEIDPGVPIIVTDHEPPLALVLKSGNFGREDFFARAALLLEEHAHD
jgi:uncharacterized protein YgbK (DUF1537 family)